MHLGAHASQLLAIVGRQLRQLILIDFGFIGGIFCLASHQLGLTDWSGSAAGTL